MLGVVEMQLPLENKKLETALGLAQGFRRRGCLEGSDVARGPQISEIRTSPLS